jgi:hypothetical protein
MRLIMHWHLAGTKKATTLMKMTSTHQTKAMQSRRWKSSQMRAGHGCVPGSANQPGNNAPGTGDHPLPPELTTKQKEKKQMANWRSTKAMEKARAIAPKGCRHARTIRTRVDYRTVQDRCAYCGQITARELRNGEG